MTKPNGDAIDTTVFTVDMLTTLDPIITLTTYSTDNSKKGIYDFKVTATTSNGLVEESLTFKIEIRWFVVIKPPYILD